VAAVTAVLGAEVARIPVTDTLEQVAAILEELRLALAGHRLRIILTLQW